MQDLSYVKKIQHDTLSLEMKFLKKKSVLSTSDYGNQVKTIK